MPRQKLSEEERGGGGKRGGRGASSQTRYAEAWAAGNYTGELGRGDQEASGDDDDEGPSTSLPALTVKMAMWDLGQCDRKRCTGTRLVRQGLVKELKLGEFQGSLDPLGPLRQWYQVSCSGRLLITCSSSITLI